MESGCSDLFLPGANYEFEICQCTFCERVQVFVQASLTLINKVGFPLLTNRIAESSILQRKTNLLAVTVEQSSYPCRLLSL